MYVIAYIIIIDSYKGRLFLYNESSLRRFWGLDLNKVQIIAPTYILYGLVTQEISTVHLFSSDQQG